MNPMGIRQTPVFFMAVQNGMQQFGAAGLQQQSSALQQFAQFINANADRFLSGMGGGMGGMTPAGFPPPNPSPIGRAFLPQTVNQFDNQLGGFGQMAQMGQFMQAAVGALVGMVQIMQTAFQMQSMLRASQFGRMGSGAGAMAGMMRNGGMGGMQGMGGMHAGHQMGGMGNMGGMHAGHQMGGMGNMGGMHAGHQMGMPGMDPHAGHQMGMPGGHTHAGDAHGAHGAHSVTGAHDAHAGHGALPTRMGGTAAVNGVPGAPLQAGQPNELAVQFTDPATGKPITDFAQDHGKDAHMIVVSDDLSSFAHVHPTKGPDGTFRIGLNSPTNDPDNQQAQNAIPNGGKYMVFGEANSTSTGARDYRGDFNATGPSKPVKLTPDPQVAPGTYQKYFNADGTEGGPGAPYQVTLKVDRKMHDGKAMMHFNYDLKEVSQDANGQFSYQPAKDMENWMGMPGHGVMIGANGESAKDRVFRHMHVMPAGGGGHSHGAGGAHDAHGAHGAHGADAGHGAETPHNGPLDFMLPEDQIPPSGTYKMWGQMKHKGKVLTFPFTFNI